MILRNCNRLRSLGGLLLLGITAQAVRADNFGHDFPLYIATDAGNIYRMDANHNVSLLTSGGLIVQAGGAAVDSHGSLFVSGYPSNIVKIDTSGQQSLFTSGGYLYLPGRLAFDKTGNLYAANVGTNTIVKIDPTGRQSTLSAGMLDLTGGLAFDDSGNLFVTAYCPGLVSCVVKIDSSSQQHVLADNLLYLDTVMIDLSGQIWVMWGSNYYFYKMTPDGTMLASNFIGIGNDLSTSGPTSAIAQDFTGAIWAGGINCTSGCAGGFGPTTRTPDGGLLATSAYNLGTYETVTGLAFSRGYTLSGFAAPVANLPSVNTGKAGRTYPIKWSLLKADNSWQSALSAVTSITFQPVACSAFGAASTTTLTNTTTTAGNLRYDSTANQYIYNLNTSSTPGCYDLQVNLDSGQILTANFQLQ